MAELPTSVEQNVRLHDESKPLVLANSVEQARRRLLAIMLENNDIANYVARQLLLELKKGGDCSDSVLIKNVEDHKCLMSRFVAEFAKPDSSSRLDQHDAYQQIVVQKTDFVQLDSAAIAERLQITSQALEIMRGLHFLPIFLISASELAQKQLAVTGRLEPAYKLRLQYARSELSRLRQEMIASNTGLVAFVAHKYKTHCLSFDDLMQEGMVGLIKAVDRFDAERGHCFSTYAVFWIKQAISRLIVKQENIVPLPVALAEKSSPVFEVMRKTYLEHERWPTLTELKDCCNLTEQEIKTISAYYQATYIAEASNQDEDDGMSIMEKMQQNQFSQPLDDLIDSDLVGYMDKALATLPEKQANILTMRFGLKNHTEMTLQAVADHLHVTRERVRQIQNAALDRLRQQFGVDLMLFLEPKDS